jgi:hypothetical protein
MHQFYAMKTGKWIIMRIKYDICGPIRNVLKAKLGLQRSKTKYTCQMMNLWFSSLVYNKAG